MQIFVENQLNVVYQTLLYILHFVFEWSFELLRSWYLKRKNINSLPEILHVLLYLNKTQGALECLLVDVGLCWRSPIHVYQKKNWTKLNALSTQTVILQKANLFNLKTWTCRLKESFVSLYFFQYHLNFLFCNDNGKTKTCL